MQDSQRISNQNTRQDTTLNIEESHGAPQVLLETAVLGSACPQQEERGRALSLRITDLIDEAFPLTPANTLEEAALEACEAFDPFDSQGPMSPSSASHPEHPPHYDADPPPAYQLHRTLAECLAEPDMIGAFAVAVKFQRIDMIIPCPTQPLETSFELMLLSPQMNFQQLLRRIGSVATDLILSERRFTRRLLRGEKVLVSLVLKFREQLRGRLRSGRKIRTAVVERNWPAVAALLRDKSQEAELKAKFWSEMPGSRAQHVREDMMRRGEMSFIACR